MKEKLKPIVNEIAEKHGLDPLLVQAIIEVESAWNPWAVRYEPNWNYPYFIREHAEMLGITYDTENQLQKMSWGLMQVMGAVTRELGNKNMLTRLTEPSEALDYACKHLKKKLAHYEIETHAIAAYNAGTMRKTKGGMYFNQVYVDKVMRVLRELRKLK